MKKTMFSSLLKRDAGISFNCFNYSFITGDLLDVLFADTDKQFTRQTLINGTLTGMGKISRVMLADFNADLNMDVLLVRQQNLSTHVETHLEIYWGNNDKKSVSEYLASMFIFIRQTRQINIKCSYEVTVQKI